MKLYKVTLQRDRHSQETLTVLARTTMQAVEDALRFAKKKWYSTCEVIAVELLNTADVFYKSRA